MDIYIGWPSQVHDACVFSNSLLFNSVVTLQFNPDKIDPERFVNQTRVHSHYNRATGARNYDRKDKDKREEVGQAGNLFTNKQKNISGVEVPILILGDPACLLLPWLMKPFPENGKLTQTQTHYNYRLS